MITVKFDKSVKYQGVRYAAHVAFKVDHKDINELKKAGATVLETEPGDSNPQVPETDSKDAVENGQESVSLKEQLLAYSVPELTKFAKERGIDLQKKTKKADIYNIIVATLD